MVKIKKKARKALQNSEDSVYIGNLSNYKSEKKEDNIFRPTSFSETKKIAIKLRDGNNVVVDINNMSKEEALRMIDFLGGVMYAKKGDMIKKESGIFFFKVDKR